MIALKLFQTTKEKAPFLLHFHSPAHLMLLLAQNVLAIGYTWLELSSETLRNRSFCRQSGHSTSALVLSGARAASLLTGKS